MGYNGDDTRDPDYSEGLRCPEPVPLSVVAGKTLSFVSETSTSGFLIPSLELGAAGVTTGDYTAIYSTASHDGSILNVYNGDAEVGVSFNDARRNVRRDFPDVGEKVIVFNITGRIANDVIAVRSELPQSLKDAIFEAMSLYINTPEGETRDGRDLLVDGPHSGRPGDRRLARRHRQCVRRSEPVEPKISFSGVALQGRPPETPPDE